MPATTGTGGDVLDNPVWHSVTGRHRPLGARRGAAIRFDPEVSPFAALPSEPGPEDWEDLGAQLAGTGGTVVLLQPSPPRPPDGWTVLTRLPGAQLVAAGINGAETDGAEALGPADVPEMLDLVGRTQPGPFAPRTIELGRYIGLRVGGALVAMAGERLRPAGYTEISAVCTDPAHQGQGLATALVLDLVAAVTARGEVAFLHALADNHRAIGLYEHLGFHRRGEVEAVVLQAPARAVTVALDRASPPRIRPSGPRPGGSEPRRW